MKTKLYLPALSNTVFVLHYCVDQKEQPNANRPQYVTPYITIHMTAPYSNNQK